MPDDEGVRFCLLRLSARRELSKNGAAERFGRARPDLFLLSPAALRDAADRG